MYDFFVFRTRSDESGDRNADTEDGSLSQCFENGMTEAESLDR